MYPGLPPGKPTFIRPVASVPIHGAIHFPSILGPMHSLPCTLIMYEAVYVSLRMLMMMMFNWFQTVDLTIPRPTVAACTAAAAVLSRWIGTSSTPPRHNGYHRTCRRIGRLTNSMTRSAD